MAGEGRREIEGGREVLCRMRHQKGGKCAGLECSERQGFQGEGDARRFGHENFVYADVYGLFGDASIFLRFKHKY
jgi:hypothetical protein